MRSPIDVMRLERMGSFHPMRLSFSRQLLRRMAHEQWHVEITDWQINDQDMAMQSFLHKPLIMSILLSRSVMTLMIKSAVIALLLKNGI